MPEGPVGAPRLTNIGPLSRATRQEVEDGWEECPKSGVESDICLETKKAALAILENQGVFAEYKTLRDINSGRCADIADRVHNQVPETKILRIGGKDHYWIKYKGLHYDVERPLGVRDYMQLPTIKLAPRDIFVKNAIRDPDVHHIDSEAATVRGTVVNVTEKREQL